jgi:hypothetical protein
MLQHAIHGDRLHPDPQLINPQPVTKLFFFAFFVPLRFTRKEVSMLEEPTQEEQQQPDLPNKALLLLKSRKFWAALIGLALIIVKGYRPDFPLTEEQLTGIVVVLVGYILGVAVEDSARPPLKPG